MTVLNDDLIRVLRGIGFSKNEALVYLATLELGSGSIWDIAKISGIKRPTCYVLLEELTVKGFASSSNDGKRTLYSVISPRQLQLAVDRRYVKFTNSLSQLEALAAQSPQKPIIRLYEGTEGVMEVYNLTLTLPKQSEILIFGTATVRTNYGDFIAEYLKQRKQKQISVRAILPDNSLNRQTATQDETELRQTRFLPEAQYHQTTEVNIFGDTIAYIAHSEKQPFATTIENSTLAREEMERFNLLWNIAKP